MINTPHDIPITPLDSPAKFFASSPRSLTIDGNQVYGVIEIVTDHGPLFPFAEIKVNGEPIAIRVISKTQDQWGAVRMVAETIHLQK